MANDNRKWWLLVIDDSYLESIRDCLSKGADPNERIVAIFSRDRFTWPLVMAACSSRSNPRAVTELIKFGADLNLQNCDGYTALHYAVLNKKLDVLNVLVESGTLINNDSCRAIAPHKATDSEEDDLTHAKQPQQEYINLEAQTEDGYTPLMFAVEEEFLKAVNILLHKGVSPNRVNGDMESPLHLALATPDPNYEIVVALLSKGADIYIEDKNGQTPMDLLIQNVRDDERIWVSINCLRAIVLRCEINEVLTLKIEAVSQLQPYFRSCCEEKEKMKESFLEENVSIHDFILDKFQENNFRDPLMQLYKPLVEWLVQGFCVEYFSGLFDRISTKNLVKLLKITIYQIKEEYCMEGTFNHMLSKDITDDLAKFLSRSDIFYLIVAVSNVKISESLEILYKRTITFL